MTWSELTGNWGHWFHRIRQRFPNLDEGSMPYLKLSRERFEAHLAETHDMTIEEARESFETFLYIETLPERQHEHEH